MDIDAVAAELLEDLRLAGDPGRAVNEKAYLKSDLEFCGVAVPALRKRAGEFLRRNRDIERDDLLGLARKCWSTRVHELRTLSILLMARRVKTLDSADIALVEELLRRSNTWAHVDPLATDVAGPLIERHCGLLETLDRWASDGDFWVRRAAMLALLRPLRRGEGDLDRFLRYADGMLEETEFFIRKAIGWILREVSKKRPDPVYDFLRTRVPRVSGVTLREAVKYLPPARRDELMAAYRARPRRPRPARRPDAQATPRA